jgi:hypothetical protein
MPDVAPLDDPDYQPLHPPVRGRVPDVVKRWGKASQLRWWRRYRSELYEQIEALPLQEKLGIPRHDDVEYWCQSEHHKGFCCYSCFEDGEAGYADWCCCRDERMRR